MVWPMVAMAAVSVVGGAIAGSKSAKAQKAAAYEQAALYDMQMREEIRRKERQHMYTRSDMQAGQFTTGFENRKDSSRTAAMNDQFAEMARDIRWMNRVRRQNVKAIKSGAQIQYQANQWANTASAISGASSAFGMWSGGTSAGRGGGSSGGVNMAGGGLF